MPLYPEEQFLRLPTEILQAREILQRWFIEMEEGTVSNHLPSSSTLISQETADKLVEILDEEYRSEMGWLSQDGYDEIPEFTRLKPEQRLALAQEIYQAIKTLIISKEVFTPSTIDCEG